MQHLEKHLEMQTAGAGFYAGCATGAVHLWFRRFQLVEIHLEDVHVFQVQSV